MSADGILQEEKVPYFIYKIGPVSVLEKQAVADGFKQAKAIANELRKQLDPHSGCTVRMIFADNELQAEDQLSRPREDSGSAVIGDD
jgi:hypothetical protein